MMIDYTDPNYNGEDYEYESNGETPAYPYGNNMGQYDGLTKRERFAMAAMQGLLSNSNDCETERPLDRSASMAVEAADELLKALEATDEK